MSIINTDGVRLNPEGHEDFTNFCKRNYGVDPSTLDDDEFNRIESEWICSLK